MHFMRIRAAGSETPMLVDNSTYYRLDSLTEDLSGAFFAAVDGADPGRSGSWWRHGGSTRHALVGPYDDHSARFDEGRLRDMIFGIAKVLHDLSQYMVLEPGDLINTGTPQGFALSGRFPYLEADDVMEVGIEGLGEQKQRLVPAAR